MGDWEGEITWTGADGQQHWMILSAMVADMRRLYDISPGGIEQVEAMVNNHKLEVWQPIETAPKDGTVIDLWLDGERLPDCHWAHDDDDPCWYQGCAESSSAFPLWGCEPTHWMPLPAPPSDER